MGNETLKMKHLPNILLKSSVDKKGRNKRVDKSCQPDKEQALIVVIWLPAKIGTTAVSLTSGNV